MLMYPRLQGCLPLALLPVNLPSQSLTLSLPWYEATRTCESVQLALYQLLQISKFFYLKTGVISLVTSYMQ